MKYAAKKCWKCEIGECAGSIIRICVKFLGPILHVIERNVKGKQQTPF